MSFLYGLGGSEVEVAPLRDKLNLPNRKVGGEESLYRSKSVEGRYLRSVVVHKDRHLGVEHQLQALSVVGNETQPEMVLVNISTTIRGHGTSPRCSITPLWEVA